MYIIYIALPIFAMISIIYQGIISRQKAEKLLENSKKGTFLVRISERIWGYAISYKSDEKIKHFLIDAGDGTYQFFGTNQLVHRSLAELVTYHTVSNHTTR